VNADIKRLLAVLTLLVAGHTLDAGSATWSSNPGTNDWNTAENWTPPTIPSSETDIATFAVSDTTNVICADSPDVGFAHTYVGGIVFAPGASAYTITITPSVDVIFPSLIVFYGEGITNNSGVAQNLVTANSGTEKASGRIYFQGASSAGENVIITNEGGASSTGDGVYGGFTEFGYDFTDTATAGKATLVNNGGTVSGAIGGFTLLSSMSNAESATSNNNPGMVSGAGAGSTLIQTVGNIGNSTFIGNPATVTGAEGGWVEIDYGTAGGASFIANGATTAGPQAGQIYVYGGDGYATFTGNGGNGSGAEGSLIDLFALPDSDQTIVIANGGTSGGLGGNILIEGAPVLDLGQFQVFGNGLLDLSAATNGITIGSLAGNGVVSLAGYSLSIGSNNLSTTFSGVIQDSGRIVKLGTGTLTLSGASTYTGGTIVSVGILKVANRTAQAPGLEL
jgi:autotransporter-associated beta strand protein